MDNTKITKYDNSINSINLFNEKELVSAENFLSKIMRSEKGGIKTVNDGLAILMRAKDLNLPFSTCIEHIHIINGKTGVDIHIIKALLLRAGCHWRVIRDYEPLYEYTDGNNIYNETLLPSYAVKVSSKSEADKKTSELKPDDDIIYVYPVRYYSDFNGNIYKDYQLNSKTHRVINSKAEAIELHKNNMVGVYRIPNRPIDFVTEYEICRTINGKEIKSRSKFSYTDALSAGLLEKDNYKKYLKVLIAHRAFTYCARDIASDILFGVCETSELKIISDKNIDETDIIDISDEEYIVNDK